MSSAEFEHWLEYLAEEPLPAPLLQMHWQSLAAIHNSGQVAKKDKSLFSAADFARPLWQGDTATITPPAPAPTPGADALRAQVAMMFGPPRR